MPASREIEFQITSLTTVSDNVALLTLDDPQSSANVMNASLQRELYARLEQLQDPNNGYRGLLVATGKSRIFIAGADIRHIAATGHYSHDQVIEFCEYGQRLYQAYSGLPFPTIALIQGACLGGGLEFALALDGRIAVQERSTLIGLPEVHLGLVPGWAATARVPRLCSIEAAMRRIGAGENFSADSALEIGVVDQLVSGEQLLETGIEKIRQLNQSNFGERRRQLQGPATRLGQDEGEEDFPSQAAVDALAETVLDSIRSAHPDLHMHAVQTVIDLIRRSALEDLATAEQLESEAMATVYTSETGQGLVNAFLLNDRAKRSPGRPPAPDPLPEIQTVGIVGLGIMGQSIAELLKTSNWNLRLYDRDSQRRLEVASHFSDVPNVQVVEAMAELAGVDVVLENVFEQSDIKRQVLSELESVVGPNTSLLTNTSVIPIQQLADGLATSQRFGGLHFFNPIRETRLAEIARHEVMSVETQWKAHLVARQAGKMSLFVGDGPGLVVNRLLMAFLNEGQHLLAEGYSIPEIDAAAQEFGWRLGPFQIMDVIGLSTAFDAGRQISRQLPQAVDAPPFLLPLIKAGRTGVAGGVGFYRYDQGNRHLDPETMGLLDHYIRPTSNERCTAKQMAVRMNGAMVGQAAELLARQQVEKACDIDLCTVLALGFPAYRGGLLFWADHFPVARLAEILQRYRPSYVLPDSLKTLVQQNGQFYGQD